MKINTDKAFNIFYKVFYGAMIAIVLFLLVAMFPIKGNYQIKIVKSGSMEPAIQTGAIVVIKPSKIYKEDDVVTFGKDTKKEIPTTHRIVSSRVESGVMIFTTKGDANEDNDTREIRQSEILGKVLFDMPYLGYLLDFAKKPAGFVIFIVIPALIVMYDEAVKLIAEFRRMKKEKLQKQENEQKNEVV